MEMTINIFDTSPKPRIINVRQYSSGVDKITFIVEDCPVTGEITANIKGTDLTQEITAQSDEDSVTAIWEIASDFTAEAGCFDVQLRLEGGGKVWLSDIMLLIVSESTDGEQTAENIKIYGDYIMPDSLMRIPDRILLDMITEKIEEGE